MDVQTCQVGMTLMKLLKCGNHGNERNQSNHSNEFEGSRKCKYGCTWMQSGLQLSNLV